MTQSVSILRANLKNPDHLRAAIGMLDLYALDPMGIGKRLPVAIKKRLAADLPKTKAVVFLAMSGKSPAGVAVCFMRYSTFSAASIFNVHDFAVSPKFRQRGVGAALLGAIENHAKSKRCKRITLEVRSDNIKAQTLYKKHGIAPGNPPYEYWGKEL